MTATELDAALRSVDGRARVVPSRILRRLAASQAEPTLLGLHIAHRCNLNVETPKALRSANARELGLASDSARPDVLFLIEEPPPEVLERPIDIVLLWGWRRLFHARVHRDMEVDVGDGSSSPWTIRARDLGLNAVEVAEIRDVLIRDSWLPATATEDSAVLDEFVSVYSELRAFDAEALPDVFPGIEDFARVDAWIMGCLDVAEILKSTRPKGARAADQRPDRSEGDRPSEPYLSTDDAVRRSEPRFRAMIARADRARATRNVVRSAILRLGAAKIVGPSRAGQARSAAEADLDRLAARLTEALDLPRPVSSGWRPSLSALADAAGRFAWTNEAKLLYDLQAACLDHEQEVFQIDLLGWIFSLGRRPLKRPLPNQTLVRMMKHLRRAIDRLPRVRLGGPDRDALTAMLHRASEAAEGKLRVRFRPLIERSLGRAGLCPANLPERVSFRRLTEELLDRIVEHKYLNMGEIRDAIARSDLRQPDWKIHELLRGDRVLKANRRFAVSLDGVYHRGEVYLRALQKASFFVFANPIGRWFTRNVALPYGGAFGALVTVQELLGLIRIHVELRHTIYVVVLGTLFLALIHSAALRRSVIAGARLCGRALHLVFVRFPAWVADRPAIRRILRSRTFDVLRRSAIQPAIAGAIAFGVVYAIDRDRRVALGISLAVATSLAALFGTGIGLEAEEWITDVAIRGYSRLRADFLPGLFKFFVDLFDAILEAVEKAIYAVDEALRFRAGQGRMTLWAKGVAGLFWGVLTYVIRIYINLLVEPQFNPIKHFPTVTVAAKMMFPKMIVLYEAIKRNLLFLGEVPAGAFAAMTVFFLPGLAGFIVWELKENWRLFEANRPKTLRPVAIGHHGETMRRLIVPGLHSGTIPKLFAKIRAAVERSYWSGDRRRVRKRRHALHEVEVPLRQFVERDFLAILVESRAFACGDWGLADVRLSTNRVSLRLIHLRENERSLVIDFSNDRGHLIGRFVPALLFQGEEIETSRRVDWISH